MDTVNKMLVCDVSQVPHPKARDGLNQKLDFFGKNIC